MRRSFTGILAAVCLAAMVLSGTVFAAEPSARLSGNNRYETALAISTAYGEKAENVVLVDGIQMDKTLGDIAFADALSGAPLAAVLQAPILLVEGSRTALPANVKERIAQLEAVNVYILGGESAVSNEIEEELRASGYQVTRIAGGNRHLTAVEVLKEFKEIQGGYKEVFITKGYDFAGSLAISAYAAQSGTPILFADRLSHLSYLEGMLQGVEKVTIVGEMDDEVVQGLEGMVSQMETIEADSVKIASTYYENPQGVYVARGDVFADALAAAPLAAKNGRPVLLLPRVTDYLPLEFAEYMAATSSIQDVTAIGGPSAVTEQALTALQQEDSSLLPVELTVNSPLQEVTQGASFEGVKAALSSEQDAQGLKIYVSLTKDGRPAIFDKVFSEFNLTLSIGAWKFGPLNMTCPYSEFRYAPQSGYGIAANIGQSAGIDGVIKADAPAGAYTVTMGIIDGDNVEIARGAIVFNVTGK